MKHNSYDNIFCIYKIINIVNEKIYIGKTYDIQKRWKRHLSIAKNKSKNYSYLHKSIEKYGSENFRIEFLDGYFSEKEAFDKEKYWIKEFKSNDLNFGINLTEGGEGTSGHSGYKWSEESRNKKRGKNNPNFGKPLSEETKQKLSIALSGENNPFYGKKHSEETINLLREKNNNVSEEMRQRISEKVRGSNQWNSKLSEENVIEIRRKYKEEEISQKDLAKEYNVKRNTINQIVHRKRWIHI